MEAATAELGKGRKRRKGDVAVHVVRRGDVDHVHPRVGDHHAPVGAPAGKTEVVRRRLGPGGIDVGHHLEHRHRRLGAEHHGHVAIRHRVRLAHPAGADQSDAHLVHGRPPQLAPGLPKLENPHALFEHARGL